jgi:hypothetical protein
MNHAIESPRLLNYSTVGTFDSHDSLDLSRELLFKELKNSLFQPCERCPISGLLVPLLPRVFELMLSLKTPPSFPKRANSDGVANSQQFRCAALKSE